MSNIVSIINVRKNSGELVPFDFQKLRTALLRSGANEIELKKIEKEIFFQLYDKITTKRIYQIAYNILKRKSKNAAGRYRLKKAIFDLGPSGYPFEKFMGRLFENRGYKVKVGQIVQGNCITHEVDVIAENDEEIIMVECKFHHQQGRKSDVKVALYIKSRFDDIHAQIKKEGLYPNKKFKGYIATNTRFTNDAKTYSRCSNVSLISWDYPHDNNLQNWVDNTNYHLITALSSATKKTKQILLENDIVLCRELIEKQTELLSLGIPPQVIKKMTKEAKIIIQ